MSIERSLSTVDHVLGQVGKLLLTVVGSTPSPTRPSPSAGAVESALGREDRRRAARLMRVNHSGEVCAQALYQGQAFTATNPAVRKAMECARIEEKDHLAWCEERLSELDGRVSMLNPLWYALSFGIGAGASLVADEFSLAFIAATEEQVCRHLQDHIEQLPPADQKSRLILEGMLRDETRHAKDALTASGGDGFPLLVKSAMGLMSKAMTKTSLYI